MKPSLIQRIFRIAPAGALVLLTAVGCRSLPDVSRFSDATTQLYVTVQTAGDSAVSELATVEKARLDGRQSNNAAKVAKGWESATVAAKAIADYSDSLQALVESGDQGKANAAKAVGAVDTLVKSVAGAYPGGEEGAVIAKGVFDGLASLYGAAARELAARKLAREIHEADPFIQKIAESLAQQFNGLALILRSAKNTLLFQVEDKYSVQVQNLNQYEGLRTALMDQARTVLNLAVTNTLLTTNLQVQALNSSQLTITSNILDRWQWAEKMVQAERQQPWYQGYLAEQAAVAARLDPEIAVAERAPSVITAWAASHKDLARAVEQNRSPNFAVLTALSQDLLATYEQTRSRVEQIKSQTPRTRRNLTP